MKIFFPSSDQRRGAAKELSKDNVSGALELRGKKFLLPSPRGWSLDAGTDLPVEKISRPGIGWLVDDREGTSLASNANLRGGE